MTFRIQPLKGVFRPLTYQHQLQKAESLKGYKLYIALLILASMLVYAISAIFGLGSESISKEITGLGSNEYEARKELFLAGRIILGAFVAAALIFLGALFFWSYVSLPFSKLAVIQMSAFSIFLVEKLIQIPLFLFLQIDASSNPLSFGVIVQYITDQELIISFFSKITIFQITMIVLIIYYLKKMAEVSRKSASMLVIGFFVFCWAVSALFSYIKIGVFF